MNEESFSLKVSNVWKTYDGVQYVLRGVNLTIMPREIVLIRGRSGSGKTTLLNLMGCLDLPTKGDIYINGFDTSKLSEKRLAEIRLKEIGIVFQSHNLIDELTIEENVLLPLKIAGRKGSMARVERLLSDFDILHLRNKRPNEVSGGEKQRVAIARALANNPKILIADEPTTSLDIENCDVVIDAFKKANTLFDTTVIIASHDPIIEHHVQKKYTLAGGKLEEE